MDSQEAIEDLTHCCNYLIFSLPNDTFKESLGFGSHAVSVINE